MCPMASIIIPIYNGERYIEQCLDSIINQSYKNIEIIAINDGSLDKSIEILEKYINLDNRIRVINQKNKGPSEARNNGLEHSNGKYILFIDIDDTVEQLYIETMVNKIESENLDLVCCGYKDLSPYGEFEHTDFTFNTSISLDEFVKLVCQGTGGVPWGKIYKHEIIKKYNLKMDKNIFMCEDLVFVLEYASHCKDFGAIDGYLYNYNRFNQDSISSNISIDYIENYRKVFNRINNILIYMEMNEDYIEKIIIDRVQGLTLSLLERQSLDRTRIGKLDAIKNIKFILSYDYINENINKFEAESLIYRIHIGIIKSRKIRCIFMFGNLLDRLKNLKRRIEGIN